MPRRALLVVPLISLPTAALADEAEPVRVAIAPGETATATSDAEVVGLSPPSLAVPVAPLAPRSAETTGLARRYERDASANRAVGFGTALVLPANSFELTWRGPVLPVMGLTTMSVGIADRVQAGASFVYVMPMMDEEGGAAFTGVSAKVQVVRSERSALAIEGGMIQEPEGDDRAGWAGAIVTTCLGDERCSTIASAHIHALLIDEQYDGEQVLPIVGGLSLVSGEGNGKAVFELLAAELDPNERAFAFYGGIRLGGRRFTYDLGLGIASDGDELVPFPGAAMSARM